MEALPLLPVGPIVKRRGRVLAIALTVAVLSVPVAAQADDDSEGSAAGIRNRAPGFETVPGGPGKRIILKPDMVSRLGIETAPLSESGQRAVPSDAIFYDAKGAAWIYVSRKPGVFAGQRVEVDSVADGRAVLADGPAGGTPVVTVGTRILNGDGVFGNR